MVVVGAGGGGPVYTKPATNALQPLSNRCWRIVSSTADANMVPGRHMPNSIALAHKHM